MSSYTTNESAPDVRVIPPAFTQTVPLADVITLESLEPNLPTLPLRISAKTDFHLGRRRQACDLIARFLPRSPENDESTMSLSSIHVSAIVDTDGVFFRTDASASGAKLNGFELSSTRPGQLLRGKGCMTLTTPNGAVFALDVEHHQAKDRSTPMANNEELWLGPPNLPKPSPGCVTFRPVDNPPACWHALWLLTSASLGESKLNPICLPGLGLASEQGFIHHYRGCFWFENHANNDTVRANNQPLRPNDLVPLSEGMTLQLGVHLFRVILGN